MKLLNQDEASESSRDPGRHETGPKEAFQSHTDSGFLLLFWLTKINAHDFQTSDF